MTRHAPANTQRDDAEGETDARVRPSRARPVTDPEQREDADDDVDPRARRSKSGPVAGHDDLGYVRGEEGPREDEDEQAG